MPLEDELKKIVEKLNHLLRENEDVDNQEWYMCLLRGTTYVEKTLNLLEMYNIVEEEVEENEKR